jgi:feruloyl esterase
MAPNVGDVRGILGRFIARSSRSAGPLSAPRLRPIVAEFNSGRAPHALAEPEGSLRTFWAAARRIPSRENTPQGGTTMIDCRAMLCGAGLAASAAFAGSALAQDDAGARCATLADMKIEQTNLLSASVVAAGEGLPAYCRVLGYVRPAVNFEIRLPLEGWNQKFYMAGCGGFCGTLDSDRKGFINAINYALKRNYAVSTMDSGHWGANVLDGRWARDNPVAEADWGWRAVKETTRVSKTVVGAYYGRDPGRSYFQGCSTGGRMANMAALRQPKDFDGIISGAPALDYTGLVATSFAWLVQANTGPDGKPILTGEDVPVIESAVTKACAAADGVDDGVIQNPHDCNLDLNGLQCAAGQTEGCLSGAKVAVLKQWYVKPVNAAGETLYPAAVPLGSEPYWYLWLTGKPGGGGLIPGFNVNFLRYMAFAEDPPQDYTAADFDFDKDPPRLAAMAGVYNSDKPDLSAFREAGGKLLLWHGWADAIVFPDKTIDYYDKLSEASGGTEATQSFARLFMLPGVDHCGLQPGPGVTQGGIDMLTALEDWVEHDEAPDQVMTTKSKDGQTEWTRPACAWPAEATYSGTGDWRAAANWHCATE